MKKIITIIVIILTFTLNIYAFSGQGSGTVNDPFLVSNADELFEVRNNLTAYYKQVEDIDLEQWILENMPTSGWEPIGNTTASFSGSYDGGKKTIKGLKINRPNNSNVGLFGYVDGAHIFNVSILHSEIVGDCYVGSIVGRIVRYSSNNTTIESNVVCDGSIKGNDFVGGIVGGCSSQNESPQSGGRSTHNVLKCYYYGNITGVSSVGGIIGTACGAYFNQRYYNEYGSHWDVKYDYYFNIDDNFSDGKINCMGDGCGGILGKIYNTGYSCEVNITKNISKTTVFGHTNVGGISGSDANKLEHNVCVSDTICSSNENAYRISPSCSSPDNYAYSETIILCNNRESNYIEENNQNGVSYGLRLLMKKSTYEGLCFNFQNCWNIIDGSTLPFGFYQSKQPLIEEFYSGSKSSLKGTADIDGTVVVFVNKSIYLTNVIDGMWELNIGSTQIGSEAIISMYTNNSQPSQCISTISQAYPNVAPEVILGDSNSDGVVDAADVVGTINYILGKPSSSFNQQNADVNEDGQILVDDAVGTVNVIMNNQ